MQARMSPCHFFGQVCAHTARTESFFLVSFWSLLVLFLTQALFVFVSAHLPVIPSLADRRRTTSFVAVSHAPNPAGAGRGSAAGSRRSRGERTASCCTAAFVSGFHGAAAEQTLRNRGVGVPLSRGAPLCRERNAEYALLYYMSVGALWSKQNCTHSGLGERFYPVSDSWASELNVAARTIPVRSISLSLWLCVRQQQNWKTQLCCCVCANCCSCPIICCCCIWASWYYFSAPSLLAAGQRFGWGSPLPGVCVYYCSTYYKAVRVGGSLSLCSKR